MEEDGWQMWTIIVNMYTIILDICTWQKRRQTNTQMQKTPMYKAKVMVVVSTRKKKNRTWKYHQQPLSHRLSNLHHLPSFHLNVPG